MPRNGFLYIQAQSGGTSPLSLALGVMYVSIAQIQTSKITDFESMHDAFHDVFVFPEFYGRNMDAWIDCMSDLDDPEAGMTQIHVEKGKVMTLELVDSKDLRDRLRDVYDAIVECSAFVNWRRVDAGRSPVLALAMDS